MQQLVIDDILEAGNKELQWYWGYTVTSEFKNKRWYHACVYAQNLMKNNDKGAYLLPNSFKASFLADLVAVSIEAHLKTMLTGIVFDCQTLNKKFTIK